ncbi:MAG TPA: YajQ family cyclic di-GMP-binding protein [Chthonomonadaceae bacterium]|nr:YajQ family cyclic di-GMP-binding protein [Chthonomonadaceae bacterium]
MATEYSFDIVSKVDLTEVKNAIDQAEREIAGRFDFRGTKTAFTLEGNSIRILSDDEFHLNMALDILRSKLAKRNVSLKALEYGKIEAAAGGTVRQVVTLRQGIPTEEAKKLVKEIKAAGIKAQAQLQGDQVRVSGKDKDALQAVQKLVRGMPDLPYDVEFVNYR